MVQAIQNAEQLNLLPVDQDDESLFLLSDRYRKLTEHQKILVRAHCRLICQPHRGKISKGQIAEESGLPRSTAYEIMERDGLLLDLAFKDAATVIGKSAAFEVVMGTIMIGRSIVNSVLRAGRSTSSITSTEVALLGQVNQMSGILSPKVTSSTKATVRDSSGNLIHFESEQTSGGCSDADQTAIEAALIKLEERQRRIEVGAVKHGRTESVQPALGRANHAAVGTPGGVASSAAAAPSIVSRERDSDRDSLGALKAEPGQVQSRLDGVDIRETGRFAEQKASSGVGSEAIPAAEVAR